MAYLGRYYRTYALDFWGFGASGKKRETYAVQDFVSLVDQFMDRLGIVQAPLVGHSMGGTVSLLVAIQFPQRVSKVVVVGSPVAGSSLAPLLKLAGIRPIARFLFSMMDVFTFGMKIYSPFICSDPRFWNMMKSDLSKTTVESFLLSIASLRRTDLRPLLHNVNVPVFAMYGDRENIVHPMQWQPIQSGIARTRVKRWPKAKHFVMIDESAEFMEKLKEFIDEEITPA